MPGVTQNSEGLYELNLVGNIRTLIVFFYLLFFLAFGTFLIISGIKVIRKEGLNLTHLLPVGFGLFSIGYVILYIWDLTDFNDESISSIFFDCFLKFILATALYIPFMVFAYFLYSFVYKKIRSKQKPDYIIVLGASLIQNRVSPLLAARLDKGIELYHQYGNTSKFVVSGGQGSDEVCSEADAMARYLMEQGIPKEHILLEDKSTNTWENLHFSKEIIDNDTKDPYYCAVVTNNYHMLRGAIFARAAGLPASGYGCKTADYYYPAAALRESIAFIFTYKALDIVAVVIFFVASLFDFLVRISFF